ncbi:MAG TPA: CpsB/CapC family capsule biosynthesis tyrosine phosphatase [Gaiellaceae bacterium]|nr:CpsB/CapC family capsule biosynthesis tyrosine phosphatase [Gaiellaceae bacterium]
MIDLHAHVLPGLDDGPATMAETLELLRDAHAAGVTRIAATPHVRHDYPTRVEEMERLVAEVNAAARDAGIPVEVLPGGELSIPMLLELDDETLRRFGLGGNPNLLLVEFPDRGFPVGLHTLLFRLATRGFRVVLAHPARNAEIQADPSRLETFVRAGALVQLTASTFEGRFGRAAQRCARELLAAGWAHVVASDAHTRAVRPTGFAGAAAAIGDPQLVRRLTLDVPAALVADAPLPPRRGRATEPAAPLARPELVTT